MKNLPFELIFWLTALLLLAVQQPAADHFSLCLLHQLGFSWCPGCGIGRAISCALHGEWSASFQTHFMGVPALFIIGHRVLVLGMIFFRQLLMRTINKPNHTYEQ